MINFPGPEKILLLAIIALVVLGPTRLPQAARTAGKWVRELRNLTARLQGEMSDALGDPKDAISAAVGDLRNEVGGWRDEMAGLRSSVTNTVFSNTATTSNGTDSTWNGNGSGPNPAVPDAPSAASLGESPGVFPGGTSALPPAPDDPSLN